MKHPVDISTSNNAGCLATEKETIVKALNKKVRATVIAAVAFLSLGATLTACAPPSTDQTKASLASISFPLSWAKVAESTNDDHVIRTYLVPPGEADTELKKSLVGFEVIGERPVDNQSQGQLILSNDAHDNFFAKKIGDRPLTITVGAVLSLAQSHPYDGGELCARTPRGNAMCAEYGPNKTFAVDIDIVTT
ncbi:hypothetical protein [Psychromicrobium sp. YIM B11713]|uniref:hypothetical protein n=1 Tax=Psychromicrobium sp. YIM B11713 TaxID=3145233 RepID=UPI00374F7348